MNHDRVKWSPSNNSNPTLLLNGQKQHFRLSHHVIFGRGHDMRYPFTKNESLLRYSPKKSNLQRRNMINVPLDRGRRVTSAAREASGGGGKERYVAAVFVSLPTVKIPHDAETVTVRARGLGSEAALQGFVDGFVGE
ncbi:hypothetical protein CEXT_278371 [Caerostris extrusa]|uniref:Uncharacterized protein n=1 Tax=Caerostris extrusa TaxID=172846 RepID=A0AAV4W6Y6_CAEEX|nr:hypothetical protein CEXT_278371 [Caerostris extrusa]